MYTDPDGEESLLFALEEGDFETALQLLPAANVTPLRLGSDQLTPLHYACQQGRLDIIEILIRDYLYDINSLNTLEPTPLQIAAASGHVEIVNHFLKNITNLVFKPGFVNPFHLAADNGHIAVMKTLLGFNSSLLSKADHDGNTPLHHACANGNLSVISFLCNDRKHPLMLKNKKGKTPLHLAVKHSHIDAVKFLIDEKKCDPFTKDSIGCTVVHSAAKSGCLDIVQYLANDRGCDFECTTSPDKKHKSKNIISGRTPLHYASYCGHCDVVAFLITEKLCNPCCADNQGFTPLHLACQGGYPEVVRFLLSLKEIDSNAAFTDGGFSPIHAASLSGNLEIMKLLIDQNDGDVSLRDDEGRTALHYSSRNGCTDVVQYLIEEKKVNCNSTDQSNTTPLHLASQYGHLDTVEYLVSIANANPSLTEGNGYTSLHLAANKGRLSVVQFFVNEKHISCMVRDKIGRTPLHHACQVGHLDVVQYLTNQTECDSLSQEKSLKATPLHLAASFGHLEIVRYLVDEKNCSLNCTDKFNSTPIHRAAAAGHCAIMDYFVKEKQCSVHQKNKFGNTPLHLACQKGKLEMVELLLSFTKENMTTRNQVGRTPLDLTDSIDILGIFLQNGIDPSKSNISTKFPYLKCWDVLSPRRKIFLLGDLDSGKSTLAKTLQWGGGGSFQEWVTGHFQRFATPDSETSGIVPITFDNKYFGRVILYDFAGHPCYHGSHSVILRIATQNSDSIPIFLITVDLRKSPESIEKSAAYWCSFIYSISGDAGFQPYLILVGTHEDELPREGMRTSKSGILEKIAGSSPYEDISFKGWISIDSRKPNSTNFHKLRQLMACDGLQHSTESAQLDNKSCLLRAFMLHKFQGTIVIEYKELLEYLSHADILYLKDSDNLYQACKSLHSSGYLLFLESKDSTESSWVIHNQETILSMVHGFHKVVEIPNPLGLVSLSQLQTGFGSMGFNMLLAIRYLLRMEFCIKLADRKILYSISGFEPPHPPEDHLFFPHLIRSSAPPDLWESDGSWGKYFGWHMECLDDHHSLGPRFHQLLLLRLSFHFPFNTNPNSPFSVKKSSCVIWRKGVSWVDCRGIEAVIEIRKQNKVVIFLARMKKNDTFELDFYHFRSSIIREIRCVKKEVCSRIKVHESIIHPGNLLQSHLSFDSNIEPKLTLFNLQEIHTAVMNPDQPSTLVHEKPLLESEQIELSIDHSLEVKDVLEFEPFMGLPNSVLKKVFSQVHHSEQISEEAYDSISEFLSALKWNPNHLLIILRLPYHSCKTILCSPSELVVPPDTYRSVFQRWAGRNKESRVYGDLWNMFSQYSIFSENIMQT